MSKLGAYRAQEPLRIAPVVYVKSFRAIALDRDTGKELWVYEAGALVTRLLGLPASSHSEGIVQ